MTLKGQRFEMTCPDCGETRDVCYTAMLGIRNGERSGSCHRCASTKRGRSGVPVTDPLAASLLGTRFHEIWRGMWGRCTNPGSGSWDRYGASGISVCDPWKSFEVFTADMYPSYRDGLTLDRKDGSGPYSPDNCRWATRKQQQNNTRTNRRITFRGRTQTVSEWAQELGMKYITLLHRLTISGWTVERALTTPVRPTTKNHY